MGSRPIDYDYNYMDGSPVVGLHPIYGNIYMAAGFNGRSAMYAPGVGRAIMELMLGKRDGDIKNGTTNTFCGRSATFAFFNRYWYFFPVMWIRIQHCNAGFWILDTHWQLSGSGARRG